jgi:hypothetical protein
MLRYGALRNYFAAVAGPLPVSHTAEERRWEIGRKGYEKRLRQLSAVAEIVSRDISRDIHSPDWAVLLSIVVRALSTIPTAPVPFRMSQRAKN